MSVLQVPVSAHDHVHGPRDAAVVLVVYGDYQCPYCGMAEPTVQRIRQELGDRVAVVFRNFPLPMHAQALPAALVAEFAGRYDRFWKAHDWLYSHQVTLGPPLYGRLLQTLQLNAEELGPAMAGGHLEARIRADIDGGERSGVDGTPAFFLNGGAIHIQHSHDELYELVLRALR